MIRLFREILHGEWGYIDIGMGSMLIQMLIAGLVAGLFMVKVYWKKIVSRVKSLRGRKNSK